MGLYKCKNCGYSEHLIFQFNTYGYCVATNTEAPEYISEPPDWVTSKAIGDAEIGEPVGCLKCHTWGVYNFELL